MARKHIALVQYNSPDLVPANLRVMAAINYSGNTPPANLLQVSSHWYDPGAAIPGRYHQLGVVQYNAGDPIPARLPVLAAMEPDLYIHEAGPRVSDNFVRGDSATSLGSAGTGQAWSALAGTWGISSNNAYRVVDGGDHYAVLESGVADVRVGVTFVTLGATQRLVFRASDVNNLWLVSYHTGAYRLFKRVASAYTALNIWTATATDGDRVEVLAVGNNIQVFVNGTLRITASDSFNSGATQHGLGASNEGGTVSRWGEFRVQEIAQ